MRPESGLVLLVALTGSVLMVMAHIDPDPAAKGAMEITEDMDSRAALPQIAGGPLAPERQVCFALSTAARSVLGVCVRS